MHQPGPSRSWVSTARSLLRLARPQQWVKNAVVLAGLVFATRTDQPAAVAQGLVAVVAFVLASAAIYVCNDLHDADEDRLHPTKHTRPIASGRVSGGLAIVFAAVLGIGGLIIALQVSWSFAGVVAAYLAMMLVYITMLRRIAILDVMIIALGFVLRAVGGAVAVSAPISGWLVLCAFLLALFLGFGKRRAEYVLLGSVRAGQRASLQGYTLPLLDQMVRISAICALVTYGIYTVDAPAAPESDAMLLTVPLVAFALFRYLYLIYGRGLGGAPEVVLYRDRWLLAAVIGWGVLALVLTEGGA